MLEEYKAYLNNWLDGVEEEELQEFQNRSNYIMLLVVRR